MRVNGDQAVKWSAVAVVVAVAGIAAVVSYNHALALVTAHGEAGVVAHLVPLTVDGLIYAASMALLAAARQRRGGHPLAYALLGLGIAATLCANVAHGLAHGRLAASSPPGPPWPWSAPTSC